MTDQGKDVSRQRRWQLARVLKGACASCGLPRDRAGVRCSVCRRKRALQRNQRRQIMDLTPFTP